MFGDPNLRPLRFMRPSENSAHGHRVVGRVRWERVFLVAGFAVAIALGLVLAAHY
jgi:hypothetical protein